MCAQRIRLRQSLNPRVVRLGKPSQKRTEQIRQLRTMGHEPGLWGLAKTLSLRRYNTETIQELTRVRLDSPRRSSDRAKSYNPWLYEDPSSARGRGCGGACSNICTPLACHSLGGETFAHVSTSWAVGSEVLLAWRIVLGIFMIGTCGWLGFHGSIAAFTVSSDIFVVQTVASCVISLPCLLPRCSGSILPVTVAGGSSEIEDGTNNAGSPWCASPRQYLYTSAVILLQSAISLSMFWDAVYWASKLHSSDLVDDRSVDSTLLHVYNIIPSVVEIVFGMTVFKVVYFLPGLLFVVTYMVVIAFGGLRSTHTDWVSSLFTQENSNGLVILSNNKFKAKVVCGLVVLYIASCAMVYGGQRIRQHYACARQLQPQHDVQQQSGSKVRV
jgi:hypothetical protein